MWARSALVALIIVGCAGCSGIKVAYNQADLIASWMADDYFDLTGDQKDAFRSRFARFHAWHRSTQLNAYAALLESARERVIAGAREADFGWAIEAVKTQYRTVVLNGYADAARVLSTLSDQQLDNARRELDKRNRQFAREWGIGAGPEEQRRLRVKRHLERIEHWTGTLSAAQEARIAAMSRELPLVTELRYQDRVRRQKEFFALLEARKSFDTFAPRLRDWLIDWDRNRMPEHEAALARFIEANAKMYVQVFALLTPEQRAHALHRLQRYINAFRELAQEAPSAAAEAQREAGRDVRVVPQ